MSTNGGASSTLRVNGEAGSTLRDNGEVFKFLSEL